MNAELQARLAEYVREGDIASVLWAFEGQIRINVIAEKERFANRDRIAELEGREALLTAFVGTWDHYYKRLFGDDWENEADAWHSLDRARLALEWLPVPDIEVEVATYQDDLSTGPDVGVGR